MNIRFTAGVFVFLLMPSMAQAASDPTVLGSFGDWSAYAFEKDNGKVCFMQSAPQQQKGIGNKKRGDVLFFITHWQGDGTRNVVSVSAGYTYKTKSTVKVKVDAKEFEMITDKDMAWTHDQKTDDALANAVRRGSTLSVTGTSTRGTVTTDVYSLKGSGDAYDAITKACRM